MMMMTISSQRGEKDHVQTLKPTRGYAKHGQPTKPHLLPHVLGMVRKHVLGGGPVLHVHDQVVASVDVIVLPEVDQIDDLAIHDDGSDEIHGPHDCRVGSLVLATCVVLCHTMDELMMMMTMTNMMTTTMMMMTMVMMMTMMMMIMMATMMMMMHSIHPPRMQTPVAKTKERTLLLRAPGNAKRLDDVLDQIVHQLPPEHPHLQYVVETVERPFPISALFVREGVDHVLRVQHLLAKLFRFKVVGAGKVLVDAQRDPQRVPRLVVILVESEALEAVQDVVDGGQVHDGIDGMQDALAVVLFLLLHQLKRREHGSDHKGDVAVVDLHL